MLKSPGSSRCWCSFSMGRQPIWVKMDFRDALLPGTVSILKDWALLGALARVVHKLLLAMTLAPAASFLALFFLAASLLAHMLTDLRSLVALDVLLPLSR